MTTKRLVALVMATTAVFAAACNVSFFPAATGGGADGQSPAPDGIDPDHPNVERRTLQVDFEDVQTLRVNIPTGRVTIRRQDDLANATVRVTKTILAQGRSAADLAQLLSASEVTIERSFIDVGRLEIEASAARALSDTDIVFDLLIAVPRAVPMEIVLDNGPVEVSDLDSDVEIRTNNGGIIIRQVTGHIVARTSERPIEIVDAAGSIEAKTSNADITIRAAPPADGFVMVETSEGNIDLAVAVDTGAAIRLDAREGSIAADLGGFDVTNLSVGADLLAGVLNGGGGVIEARTTAGEITFIGL